MTLQALTEDGDEVVVPLTAEERRALARAEAAQLARDSATSGKGNGPSVIDQFRASQRPEYLPGRKIQTGPIASVAYAAPIDLDPRNVDALLPTQAKHDVDADGKPRNVRQEVQHADVLALTRAAFNTAFTALDAVGKARAAASGNEAWTPAQQLMQVGKFSEQHFDRITQSFDRARKNLEDFVSALDKSLNAPLESRDPLDVEVRKHVQKLPEAKRAEFVGEALKNNDIKTLQAVLGAPHYLSGLGKAHHDGFTRLYRENANPVATARLDVAKKGLALIDARAGLVFGEIQRAMGGSFGKLNKIRVANSAAEAALVMQSGLE